MFLTGTVKRPDEGGLLGPETLGVAAVVASFPFLREGRVVDFMKEAGEWYGEYAGRVAGITSVYNEALVARAGADLVPILMAHFLVSGVRVDRNAPRGERELHMGDAYAATSQAIPAGPQYVAMGHIHAPQKVPGAPVPAEYAGSLLALDFGEAGEQKRVVIVDAEPGRLAVAEIDRAAGRPPPGARHRHVGRDRGAEPTSWPDAFLDLTVKTSGTDTSLAERARETFPYLVKVRAYRAGSGERERVAKAARSWPELYGAYYRQEHPGEEPPDALLALFRDVLEEVGDATA